MSEKDPNESKEDRGIRDTMGRLSRTVSFWILLGLITFLMVNLLTGETGEEVALSYTEFRSELAADNIDAVTIIGGKQVEGELRAPVEREGEEFSSFRTVLPGEIGEALLSELEEREVVVHGEVDEDPWWTALIAILPWIIFIVIFIWILRAMQAGSGKAFQFGRSKAKLITPDKPTVTFADVAGADEAKEELQEVVEFLKDPEKFGRLGARLPKGVLLVGPPGTGKTLLARAASGEAGRPFFQMSGSDFVEMFVGVGASRVRDLFEQAKSHAPCIIFIDEMDAVGRQRGAGLGGGHDEREQTLNQLLVEMDGFEATEGVILLAATNRPDVLDPALLRPGRFDRHVVVDAPDVRGREAILEVHARKMPLADDVDLSVIARGTPGLSGADLANICNEAALFAARRNTKWVSQEDLEQAKDKIMLGSERRSMLLTDAERRLTAYHEAGHAVVGLKLPGLDPVHKVTIVPRGRALGLTASLPEEDRHSYTKEWLVGQLCMLFGGRVAEEMVFGEEQVTTGAGNDIDRATQIARRMVTQFGMSDVVGPMAVGEGEHEVFLGRELSQRRVVSEHTAQLVDQEVKRILNEAYQRTRKLLTEEWDLLERITASLLERETLNRHDIDRLSRGEPLPPMEESRPEPRGRRAEAVAAGEEGEEP